MKEKFIIFLKMRQSDRLDTKTIYVCRLFHDCNSFVWIWCTTDYQLVVGLLCNSQSEILLQK